MAKVHSWKELRSEVRSHEASGARAGRLADQCDTKSVFKKTFPKGPSTPYVKVLWDSFLRLKHVKSLVLEVFGPLRFIMLVFNMLFYCRLYNIIFNMLFFTCR